MDFAGITYDHARDSVRLTQQLQRVHKLTQDGEFRTLHSIAMSVHGSEAGVSARLRDLRKKKFGAHVVQKRRIKGGLWEYRMLAPCSGSCPVLALECGCNTPKAREAYQKSKAPPSTETAAIVTTAKTIADDLFGWKPGTP